MHREAVMRGQLRKSAIAPLLILAACHREASNEILARFTMAGGGDPKQIADGQLKAWFASHGEIRNALIPLCAAKRKSASGDWARTDEGRVCAAVPPGNFVFYTP